MLRANIIECTVNMGLFIYFVRNFCRLFNPSFFKIRIFLWNLETCIVTQNKSKTVPSTHIFLCNLWATPQVIISLANFEKWLQPTIEEGGGDWESFVSIAILCGAIYAIHCRFIQESLSRRQQISPLYWPGAVSLTRTIYHLLSETLNSAAAESTRIRLRVSKSWQFVSFTEQ